MKLKAKGERSQQVEDVTSIVTGEAAKRQGTEVGLGSTDVLP